MRRKRGIALILVLSVTGLLVMLTGALVGNHQSNFALLGGAMGQRKAMLAARSGLDIARYNLERKQDWGSSNFSGTSKTWGEVTVTELAGKKMLQGTYADGRSFLVDVENLIAATAATGELPPHCVRLTVTGRSLAFEVRLQTILVQAPLYDSAASSNADIDMTGVTNWKVQSQDPLRNWVRSNHQIKMKDVTAGAGNVSFNSAIPGVAWSKDDILVGAQTLSNATAAFFGNVRAATNARMTPKSTLNYDLYDLKLTDLQAPPGGPVDIGPGQYILQDIVVPYQKSHFLAPNTNESAAVAALVYSPPAGPNVTYMLSSSIPSGPSVSGVVLPPGTIPGGNTVTLAPGFVFDFTDTSFTADNAAPLRVNGDLTIGSLSGTLTPDFRFGASYASGSVPAFVNATGSINLAGKVKGKGALAAQGNIRIAAESSLTTDPTAGVVLWSGNTVTLDATSNTVGNMTFQGLVYTKNDILINPTGPLDNFKVDGALVAQSGQIQMTASNVTFKYNPDYLDKLTKGLPMNRTRLSQISYRIL